MPPLLVVANRLQRVALASLFQRDGEPVDHVEAGERVDMGAPVAAPLGLGRSTGGPHVLGDDEDHFVVLAHAPGTQVTPEKGGEEMHAGSVASTKGR